MIPNLSTNAFKFLRSITKKAGLECSDEEIHDMGIRLLTLCEAVAESEKDQAANASEFTDAEAKAIEAIQEHLSTTGNIPSVRELSRALGYHSSRSGHILFKRLVSKGALVRGRDNRGVVVRKIAK